MNAFERIEQDALVHVIGIDVAAVDSADEIQSTQ